MGKLLKFYDKNEGTEETEETEEFITGEVRCLICKHEWIYTGKSPLGGNFIECPECKTEKGVLKYVHVRKEKHWVCSCTNEYFSITERGIYCPNCGAWQTGFEK